MPNTAQAGPAPRRLRVVIADPHASDRDCLVNLCSARHELDAPVVAHSGAQALAQIRECRPDLALLACELRDMSGFDVLRGLESASRPATILTAPDERHAVEALPFAPIEYLTLPVSEERFAAAVQRAMDTPRSGGRASEVLLSADDRLLGERARRLYFLAPADIDYIEADSNYLRIHVGTESYINRDSLGRLTRLLERRGFARISRSVLLNFTRVLFAERAARGALAFTFACGSRVVSSTTFRLGTGAYLRVAYGRPVQGGGRAASCAGRESS